MKVLTLFFRELCKFLKGGTCSFRIYIYIYTYFCRHTCVYYIYIYLSVCISIYIHNRSLWIPASSEDHQIGVLVLPIFETKCKLKFCQQFVPKDESSTTTATGNFQISTSTSIWFSVFFLLEIGTWVDMEKIGVLEPGLWVLHSWPKNNRRWGELREGCQAKLYLENPGELIIFNGMFLNRGRWFSNVDSSCFFLMFFFGRIQWISKN